MSVPHDRMIADKSEKGARVRRLVSTELTQSERNDYEFIWEYVARKNQLPPPGDWRVWMIMAGRGFGKTRAGAEWVRMIADSHPHARIALVSSSLAEARAVMVEGESGLLAICRFAAPDQVRKRGAGAAVLGGRTRKLARAAAQPRLPARRRRSSSSTRPSASSMRCTPVR